MPMPFKLTFHFSKIWHSKTIWIWTAKLWELGQLDTLILGQFDIGAIWYWANLTLGQFDIGTIWYLNNLTLAQFDIWKPWHFFGTIWYRDKLTLEQFYKGAIWHLDNSAIYIWVIWYWDNWRFCDLMGSGPMTLNWHYRNFSDLISGLLNYPNRNFPLVWTYWLWDNFNSLII